MPQRQIHLKIPRTGLDRLESLCESARIISAVPDARNDSDVLVQILVGTEHSEALLDRVQQHYGSAPGFRLTMVPVEAALPRPGQPPGDEAERAGAGPPGGRKFRISREELYQEISAGIKVSGAYIAMAVLSAIVAAIGLYRDDLVVLIGAMVIAPLLTPNVALALSAALGDAGLAVKAIWTNTVGVTLSLLAAVLIGAVMPIEPELPALAARSQVSIGDILLALASGVAGTLAFTTGLPSALIGVMVAVALMPPLVAFGLLAGSGHLQASLGALLLLSTNVICLNLAAILTFAVQGIRPRNWWESRRARKATRWAATIWAALLAGLGVLLYLSRSALA
ncbi:MAG: TIGR00341 family protein [Xanthomonadales bacterium]|nr:TIGR00341 family protein [Xanthomonadales bacterium]NIN59636.1 TIGR00341 family protein [Xanthomonadales bacterium]NIN75049.1 TIGR00341 family protein [Xanthomonadales bacterium]NIO14137.1 TIGR00341 family protein [Xanthomonadales bacterium]NIP12029.1 TIGR00341 family protein [Xanthomonadales bacterium]